MKMLHLYARVLGLLGEQALLGWILAAANVALALAQFAEPVLFGRIIDALAGAKAGESDVWLPVLLPLVAAWVGFGLFTIVCGALVSLYADRLAHSRRHAVLSNYFEHVIQLPLSFHSATHSGRLMKVMLAGTDTLWALWLGFFREHLAAFAATVILLPMALYMNWRLALLLFALCLVFVVLTTLVLRKTETLQSAVERYYSDLAERASDTLGNVALVQSFTRVEVEVLGLRSVIDRLLGAQMPVLSWWALVGTLTRASTTLTMLAILLLGLWLFARGQTTIGEIVMFMSFAGMLIQRLEQMAGFVNRIFMDGPRLTEFFAVLDATSGVVERKGAMALDHVRGDVAFEHVTFGYDGAKPAVEDLSFTAKPGDTIALVGGTGAGKSTALAILHRVYDPQSGRVTIDGTDIRDITLASLRRKIGVVFQEPLLFNRSIAENLRVGNPDATDEQIREACRRAQALDFIERHAGGLNANVGERGRALSGGERQRLSIARALLKDPPILILDEATSALDAATETKVNAALDEVMKGRTSFVIAHRLATVRDATCILVFDQGRIVERGTFDELVAQGGLFAELAKAQFMTGSGASSG
ncbi:MAG: glucan ABC transporter ATP-binding protein/ permease [Rhizobiales bacterium]|nr:glucan ABC transporter ATP-binding protein/ permease [Hyphomicrobiales bacterium]OJY45114.1 MAG: cyclic beta-1,2-glucan ABC transporter [Rhizobiales bacterium 64-17]